MSPFFELNESLRIPLQLFAGLKPGRYITGTHLIRLLLRLPPAAGRNR
jgi:hypothetical protein